MDRKLQRKVDNAVKMYIMFCFIEDVGGGQNYVNSKVEYLKKNGWSVTIFSPGMQGDTKKIPWNNLAEYAGNSSKFLAKPLAFWGKHIVNNTLNWMQLIVGQGYDEIIIESHTDFFAEWGECLAQRVGAKHICFLLDERLEKYGAKEFLYYKYLRNEVAGIHISSIPRLFKGYCDVPENPRYVLAAVHNGGIQDVSCAEIDCLPNKDWNIAYIGRSKQYENNIISGIVDFSNNHKENSIQFIVLGEVKNDNLLKKVPNLTVTKLGFYTPIPRSFFEHVDVVIAGAGCAMLSAREKTPTIVAEPNTCLASGIYGYTVCDSLFSDNHKMIKFDEALEQVLIQQVHKKNMFTPPTSYSCDTEYKNHFKFIQESCQKQEYFDFAKHPQNDYKILKKPKYLLYRYTPNFFCTLQQIKAKINPS